MIYKLQMVKRDASKCIFANKFVAFVSLVAEARRLEEEVVKFQMEVRLSKSWWMEVEKEVGETL